MLAISSAIRMEHQRLLFCFESLRIQPVDIFLLLSEMQNLPRTTMQVLKVLVILSLVAMLYHSESMKKTMKNFYARLLFLLSWLNVSRWLRRVSTARHAEGSNWVEDLTIR